MGVIAAGIPGGLLWAVTLLGLVVAAIGVGGVLLDMLRRHRNGGQGSDGGFVAKMMQLQITVSESVGLVILGAVFAVGVWVVDDAVDGEDNEGEVTGEVLDNVVVTTFAATSVPSSSAVPPTTSEAAVPSTIEHSGPISFPESAYGIPDEGGWYNAPADAVRLQLVELGLRVRVFDQGCSGSVDEGNVRMITVGGTWNEGILFGKSSDDIDDVALANLMSGDEVQVWLSTMRPCP